MSDGAKKKGGGREGGDKEEKKINVKSWKESTENRQAQMVRKQKLFKVEVGGCLK